MSSIRTAFAGMVVAVALVVGTVAHADVSAESFQKDEKYFTIGSMQIIDMTNSVSMEDAGGIWIPFPIVLPKPPGKDGAKEPATPIDEAELILDKLINMGKKVWAIVEAGRPAVSYNANVATAVPAGLTRWDQLGEWQAPKARVYRAVYKNLYGGTVVDFSYRVLYTAGGTYNGKGRFLTQVTVVPGTLNVAWGYKFNAEVTVPSVINMGSSTDPVAGMELLIHWKVDTVMKHSETSTSYFIQGDGTFKDLTNGG